MSSTEPARPAGRACSPSTPPWRASSPTRPCTPTSPAPAGWAAATPSSPRWSRPPARWTRPAATSATARELAAEDASFAARGDARSRRRSTELTDRLRELLLPKDPDDDKDVILEIKAGEGGAESALFAGDLLRMYLRYAERRGWSTEVLDAVDADLGGYKDVAVAIKSRTDEGIWSRLKFEGGVHRVQRVPVTESQGRIHTSAAGVLVLPEAEEVDVTVDPNDLRIDVFRSSGPGRAEREHHRLRRPHHPPAHRHRGQLAEREEPAAEPGVRAAGAALAAAGRRPRGGRGRGQRPAAQPGAHGRPQRAGAHLQLPGEPDLRPPGRLQGLQPRPGRSTATSTRCIDALTAAHTAELLAAGS